MADKEGEGEALVEDIIQSVATEHPLHEMNLTIEIDVSFESGVILYGVRVENRTGKVIRKVLITPDIDEKAFAMEDRAKTLGPLPPNTAQTAIFRIKPQKETWDFGVEGKVIGGRDVALKGVLKVVDGKPTYEMTVENRKDYSMRFLKVKPLLPVDFVALEKEKTISLLATGEKRTVTFEVIPRPEFEAKQRHQEGLKKPWLFEAERPRRKRRGYPRAYSRAEMAEIKRFLLFTEADVELLKLIGDKGINEEAEEVGLIFAYRETIEEPAIEEEFQLRKYRIGEPLDEGTLELNFDLKPLIKLSIRDEDPSEMDFDIEEMKDVRPLELAGAQAEDIEIEPMEMDI
jgi:hypothetical protein